MKNIRLSIWTITSVINAIIGFIVLPIGIITKNGSGLICGIIGAIPILGSISEAIFLLILTFIWCIFYAVILVMSKLSEMKIVGIIFALLGMPFVIVGQTFLNITPSFARIFDLSDPNAHSYWRKELACATYPFSHKFSNIEKITENITEEVSIILNSLMSRNDPLAKFVIEWTERSENIFEKE